MKPIKTPALDARRERERERRRLEAVERMIAARQASEPGSLADRAREAAEACCDPDLAALLLDLARGVEASIDVRLGAAIHIRASATCVRCDAEVKTVGDGHSRRGMCCRCYDAVRHVRRRGTASGAL